MAIAESSVTRGTWWVTDPSRPGAKVCLRILAPQVPISPWYVCTINDKLVGRYVRGDLLDALAVAEKMLEELPSDGN